MMGTEDSSTQLPSTVGPPNRPPTPPARRHDALVKDVWRGFYGFLQGMWVTIYNMLARRKITVQYPLERLQVAPRFRGLFYLSYDEEAERLDCVACRLCEQACPTNVISMTKIGAGKNAGVSEFDMDLGRCMFCNLCIEACPFDAIHMGPEYELASYNRDASHFSIEILATGGKPAVEKNIETINELIATQAAEKAAQAAEKAALAAEKAAKAKPAGETPATAESGAEPNGATEPNGSAEPNGATAPATVSPAADQS